MRSLSVIILLVSLILPFGQASGSSPSDISSEELKTIQTQAAQGNADAQLQLGDMFDTGKGVPQNYRLAREWYEKAAAQGNTMAQLFLGWMYRDGHGVPQDYTKARQWYEKSAALGDTWAQVNLGWIYLHGQGVPKSLVQAHMWLSTAAAQGNELAVQERDKLVMKMTPTQIADAQRLAQQCQAQQLKGC